MSGATHPLLQYAFMAWCLVKSTGITLLLHMNLCFSLRMRDHNSHLHKMGQVIVFNTVSVVFFTVSLYNVYVFYR
jgi:hypothetical protein